MPSRAHKKLIERIGKLDKVPDDAKEYETWLEADALSCVAVETNLNDDQLIVYATIESAVHIHSHRSCISFESVSPVDQADLLRWSR